MNIINTLKTCRETVHTNGATVEAGDYFTAVPTRIRIIRPRISTELWQSRTSDRLVLSVSEIVRQQRLQDLSSREWITVGVLISKSSPLLSRKGNSYSIWKLNDLADLETRVSLFLFGRIQNELWKESEGSVIAILKPKIMESKEQASLKSEDVSLTVDDSVQVLVLGHSLDAGTCLGTTKSGNKCTKIVNKSRSKYCDFHVKSAYKKATVSRPGFANITFPTFKNEAKRQSQPGVFIGASYSGQTLEPPEKKPRLGKLTDFSLKSLENRPELSNNVVNWGLVDQASFSKVVKNKEKSSQKTVESPSKCETPSTSKSSSKANPLETRHQEILSSNEDAFASMLSRPSAGSMNFFKHLIQKELPESSSTGSSSRSASKQPSLNKSNSFSSFFTNMAKGSTPCLGRGASNEGFVNLTSPPTGEKLRARALNKKELIVRQRAIELVRSKGGVANMIKTAKEKRHKEIKDKLEVAALKKSQQSESSSKKSTSKTVNGLDLNSEELRRRLSKGSRHSSLVDVQERIEQDAYFDKLAHKEQLEEKLISMQEQKVKVVYCKMCRYKSITPSELCKSSNHPLVRYEGLLRYFKCSDCKERTTTLDRYPTIACKKCEGSSFVKTGMKPERMGPKLESETLLIRGEERKWVNS